MSAASTFFDTNVLLYMLSNDLVKAGRAEITVAMGGVISVQVLNEFVSVARRTFKLSWPEIADALAPIHAVCRVVPLTRECHDIAVILAARYVIHIYDAMIVAAAISAGCSVLQTEDLQHGQLFARRLRVNNPFLPAHA